MIVLIFILLLIIALIAYYIAAYQIKQFINDKFREFNDIVAIIFVLAIWMLANIFVIMIGKTIF